MLNKLSFCGILLKYHLKTRMLETGIILKLRDLSELFPGQEHRPLGAAALQGSAELTLPDRAELPEGFAFAEDASIDPAEVVALLRTTDMAQDVTLSDFLEIHKDLEEDGYKSAAVGVRNTQDNRLVGYGGLIYNSVGIGNMGNFVVSPEYQGRGIGKAIIDERLVQAAKLGIHTLSTTDIQPGNTLVNYYLKRGFVQDHHILDESRFVQPVSDIE